jgi:hypothetical protein
MKLRTQLVGLAALAVAVPTFAQVKLNDTITVTGWAVGSYQYTKPSPGTYTDSFNLDAGYLGVTVAPPKTKTTFVASLYYRPSAEGGVSPSGSEVTLLDAYVQYAASDTITLEAGKFLSPLGYESFYLNQDNMITLANQAFLGPIPGYHEGASITITPTKTDTLFVDVVDSLYQKPGTNATEGDGEFKHNGGAEAYYQNTAVPNLTVWLGGGYESKTKPGVDTDGVQPEPLFSSTGVLINPDTQNGHDVWVADLWASYVVDKAGDTLAAEEIYKDGGFLNKGSNWLAYFKYNVPNSKVYSWFCVSGEDVTGGASYVKGSISPTYVYNSNFWARAQYSYTSYSHIGGAIKDTNYFGVEVGVQF